MSKHQDRKRAETKPTPANPLSPRQEVEHLIRKGRLKDAVKQAKLCYARESTPEHHQLLEQAYFLRAQQLQHDAMPTSAAEVAQHLLDLGVTDPSLPPKLAPLLLAVGLTSAAMAMGQRLESSEDRARLLLTTADQAVLHPDRAPASLNEIREGARLIREAWAALDAETKAGAETAPLDRLRGIARSSPFADWRYFLRGLAAMRRYDDEQVAANWDRLDANRAASRIARALRSLISEPSPSATTTTTTPNLKSIETLVLGEPLLEPLQQLRLSVAEGRWTDAIPLLTVVRFSLQRIAPPLAQRLTQILLRPLAHKVESVSPRESRQLISGFMKAAEPLPFDPRWNRFRALIAEGPLGDYDEAENHWKAYLVDLETLPSLSPAERRRAQALVWEHLAFQYAEGADDDDPDLFTPPRSSKGLNATKRQAIDYLEKSLNIDPTYLTAHLAIISCHERWNQPDRAEAAANRLLTVYPNHYQTLDWLIRHFQSQGKAEQSLPWIQRARELKPLAEDLRQSEWAARVSLARHYALQGRWDEGRAEFALADSLWKEQTEKFTYAARKAVFELKAGQAERAEEFITAAQVGLVEPAPLWLAILIEGARYELSKSVLKRFEDLWDVAQSKKGKSETLGALAELLMIYIGGNIHYPDQRKHVGQLVNFLKRASRIRYQRNDLLNVCVFLNEPSTRTQAPAIPLLENLAKRGVKNFPDHAGFHYITALNEFTRGPFHANLHLVRTGLLKARQLAQASTDPGERRFLTPIKNLLAEVEAIRPSRIPFPDFGRGGGASESYIDLFSDLFYIDDQGDDSGHERGPASSRRGQSSPKKTPKKKQK